MVPPVCEALDDRGPWTSDELAKLRTEGTEPAELLAGEGLTG
ncbi:MAG: hypothetical protein ACRDXE_02830 [Acidimicrobiales bacterium]